MEDRKEYKTAVEDLEKIIACETSGLTGSIPEQDDHDLAKVLVTVINHEARHVMSREAFARRVKYALDEIVVEAMVKY